MHLIPVPLGLTFTCSTPFSVVPPTSPPPPPRLEGRTVRRERQRLGPGVGGACAIVHHSDVGLQGGRWQGHRAPRVLDPAAESRGCVHPLSFLNLFPYLSKVNDNPPFTS